MFKEKNISSIIQKYSESRFYDMSFTRRMLDLVAEICNYSTLSLLVPESIADYYSFIKNYEDPKYKDSGRESLLQYYCKNGDAKEIQDRYNGYFYKYDLMAHAKLPDSMKNELVITSSGFVPAENEYLEYLHSRKVSFFINLYLFDSDHRYMGRIVIAKSQTLEEVSPEEMVSLRTLAEFLSIEFAQYLQSFLQSQKYNLMKLSFDNTSVGIAYMNDNLQILFANKRFNAICDSIIKDKPEVFPYKEYEKEEKNRAVLMKILQPFGSAYALCSTEYSCSDGIYSVNVIPCITSAQEKKLIYMMLINFTGNSAPSDNVLLKNIKFAKYYKLSSREAEVMDLLLDGFSSREISEKLFISSHTVKAHVHNIYGKIGIRNKGELVKLFKSFSDK